MNESPTRETSARLQRIRHYMQRWVTRVLYVFAASIAVYLLFVVIGLVPINRGFVSVPDDEPGVTIYVLEGMVHSDLVIPIHVPANGGSPQRDWSSLFPADDTGQGPLIDRCTHLAVGWGDRGFYLDTPTWSELKFSTAVRALFWPSTTCLHVQRTQPQWMLRGMRSVRMSHRQYQQLAEFIDASVRIESDEQRAELISGHAYGDRDAFYAARGTYWFGYTCNSWVGHNSAR
ncbi:MAG: DUF2459 domain-containing protein, partial [Planctomycetota bacterium]